jgi:acetone carboxylase gamma subunit
MKECPLCAETMRLSVREVQDRVPGVSQPAIRVVREWICPECDYFEEAEAGEE